MHGYIWNKLVACFLLTILIFSFHYLVSEKIKFVTYTEDHNQSTFSFIIQDYAYHMILIKTFWFEGFGDIYKLSFQQGALSRYIGSRMNLAMLIGITPIALVIWLPFAFVANYSIALSYTLWMAFSLYILFSGIWRIFRKFYGIGRLPLLPVLLIIMTVLSYLMITTVYLGQTAIFASGLLIHMIFYVHEKKEKSNSASFISALALIFLSGIKPVYLILSLGLVIIYGLWLEALYALLIVFLFLIGITPLLTLDWIPSYLIMLQIYNTDKFPQAYAWAYAPESMDIFRSAFRNMIGDFSANLISNMVTFFSYISVIVYSITQKMRHKLHCKMITQEQIFIIFVAVYLLFAPYANGCEDLILLPIFIIVLISGNIPKLTDYKSLISILSLYTICLYRYLPFSNLIWIFWILKLVLLSCMVYFCRYSAQILSNDQNRHNGGKQCWNSRDTSLNYRQHRIDIMVMNQRTDSKRSCADSPRSCGANRLIPKRELIKIQN